MDKWFAIFKAGCYPQGCFLDKELAEIVSNFDRNEGVPIVIGHPQKEDPAFGWVDELKVENGILYAKFRDVVPEFAEAVNAGRYEKISVKLLKTDKGWKLAHVGFFGAFPVQISDLPPVKFENKLPSVTVYFLKITPLDKLPLADPGTKWDGDAARKRVFDKYGIEGFKAWCLYRDPEADPENKTAYKFLVVDIIDGEPKIVPKAVSAALAYLHGARGVEIPEKVRKVVEPKINKLRERIKKELGDKEFNKVFKEVKDMDELEKLKRQFEEEKKKIEAEFSSKLEEKDKRLKELEAEFAKAKRQLREKEIEEFLKLNENKIPPAVRQKVKDFMLSLDESVEVEFSGGGKKSAFDALREIIEAYPDMSFLFNKQEKPKDDRKTKEIEREKKIAEFLSQGMTAREAVLKVKELYPELFEEE